MALLTVRFDTPRHGWLQVHIKAGESVVDFAASYTPNNPVQQLVDALALAMRGAEATVWWNLEPDGYYFRFNPAGAQVSLQVLRAHNSKQHLAAVVATVEGTREEILLPIWRALRRLQELNPPALHWPSVNFEQLPQLRAALRGENGS